MHRRRERSPTSGSATSSCTRTPTATWRWRSTPGTLPRCSPHAPVTRSGSRCDPDRTEVPATSAFFVHRLSARSLRDPRAGCTLRGLEDVHGAGAPAGTSSLCAGSLRLAGGGGRAGAGEAAPVMPGAAAIGVEPPGPFFEGHWFQTERLMASHGLAGVFGQETLELA